MSNNGSNDSGFENEGKDPLLEFDGYTPIDIIIEPQYQAGIEDSIPSLERKLREIRPLDQTMTDEELAEYDAIATLLRAKYNMLDVNIKKDERKMKKCLEQIEERKDTVGNLHTRISTYLLSVKQTQRKKRLSRLTSYYSSDSSSHE